MRTTDPNTILQWQLLQNAGGIRTPTQQFSGIHDGYILDTYATNPGLNKQPGYCRVVVPITVNHAEGGTSGYDHQYAIGPGPYPGTAVPPDGTACVVGFIQTQSNSDSSIDARVLAFVGWSESTSSAGLIEMLPAVAYTSITRNLYGTATSASVTWPDGTFGVYTATNLSSLFTGAVDAYTVTYLGSVTRTLTQPTVTRDSSGAVINQPVITVT